MLVAVNQYLEALAIVGLVLGTIVLIIVPYPRRQGDDEKDGPSD